MHLEVFFGASSNYNGMKKNICTLYIYIYIHVLFFFGGMNIFIICFDCDSCRFFFSFLFLVVGC